MNSQHSIADGRLTDGQRRKIFAAARELQLTDEALHQLLEQVIGKTSIRALAKAEARLFIDYLVDGLGASGNGRDVVPSRPATNRSQVAAPCPRPTRDNIIRLATRPQLEKIAYLITDLGLTWDNRRFLGVVARAAGRSRIRTTLDASRVIDALVAIRERTALQRQESRGVACDNATPPDPAA